VGEQDQARYGYRWRPGIDDLAELHGVPEYDDGGEQVHSGDAIVLAFAGSIPDFTSAVEAMARFRAWWASPLLRPI
jgi:hypothetical protein